MTFLGVGVKTYSLTLHILLHILRRKDPQHLQDLRPWKTVFTPNSIRQRRATV